MENLDKTTEHTDSAIVDEVPTFVDKGESKGESTTELEQTSVEDSDINTELDSFISDAQAPVGDINGGKAAPTIEKLTQSAARGLINAGLTKSLGFISMLAKADYMLTPDEIDAFAKDISPVLVKYGNQIEDMPPWLKKLFAFYSQNKEVLIAFKGCGFLTFSLYMKHKQNMTQKAIELERLKQQNAQAAASKTPEQATDQTMDELTEYLAGNG